MINSNFTFEIAQVLFDSSEEFPVNFDDAWQWLGYSRKDNAKTALLNSGFELSIDFLINQEVVNHPQGGSTMKEQIALTVDCFKSWGMMAGTEQGKQIRKYFLECERVAKQLSAEKAVASVVEPEAFKPVDRSFISAQSKQSTGNPDLDLLEWCRLERAKYLAAYANNPYSPTLKSVINSIDSMALAASQRLTRSSHSEMGLKPEDDEQLDKAGRDKYKISINQKLIAKFVEEYTFNKKRVIVQEIGDSLIGIYPDPNICRRSVQSRIQYILKEMGWYRSQTDRIGEGKNRRTMTIYEVD